MLPARGLAELGFRTAWQLSAPVQKSRISHGLLDRGTSMAHAVRNTRAKWGYGEQDVDQESCAFRVLL